MNGIHGLEYNYVPHIDNAEQLFGNITLVSVLGPMCVGKTTIISRAASLDSEFGRVVSFTTRPERSEDDDQGVYDMWQHDAESLSSIRRMAIAGRLVQFAVHPASQYVYGSMAQDYRHRFSMLDTMPSALASAESLPFKAIKRMAIVVPADEWERRVRNRSREGALTNVQQRLQEGLENIDWALTQSPDDIAWIVNGRRSLTGIARHMIAVARGEQESAPSARAVAERLRVKIHELLAA